MALCEMCGMGWCGRPCIHDSERHNALLFHRDGRPKTLRERGLGLEPGEIDRRRAATEQAARDGVPYDYKPFAKEALDRAREQGLPTDWLQFMPPDSPFAPAPPARRKKPTMVLLKALADTGGTKTSGTKTLGTKTPVSVPPLGTKTRHGGGRPKTGKAMTAAERKRRWLERQKKEKP